MTFQCHGIQLLYPTNMLKMSCPIQQMPIQFVNNYKEVNYVGNCFSKVTINSVATLVGA
jgi:hypothetical protein